MLPMLAAACRATVRTVRTVAEEACGQRACCPPARQPAAYRPTRPPAHPSTHLLSAPQCWSGEAACHPGGEPPAQSLAQRPVNAWPRHPLFRCAHQAMAVVELPAICSSRFRTSSVPAPRTHVSAACMAEACVAAQPQPQPQPQPTPCHRPPTFAWQHRVDAMHSQRASQVDKSWCCGYLRAGRGVMAAVNTA